MKKSSALKAIGAVGLMALVSACATNTTGPDVVATEDPNAGLENRAGFEAGSQADLEQNAGHRVFFGYDQYSLTSQAQATLARQAEWLKGNPSSRILVAGNCDERGTREYNLALGARRAAAARAYLVSLGVDGSRVSTVSYGKERPLDTRSSSDAWALNRNATSTIVVTGA